MNGVPTLSLPPSSPRKLVTPTPKLTSERWVFQKSELRKNCASTEDALKSQANADRPIHFIVYRSTIASLSNVVGSVESIARAAGFQRFSRSEVATSMDAYRPNAAHATTMPAHTAMFNECFVPSCGITTTPSHAFSTPSDTP